MKVVNNSKRLIALGEVNIVPTMEAEVPKSYEEHPRVKALIESGELSVVKEKAVPKGK